MSGARIAIVGGGPAGLMAAEVANAAGIAVDVYDAKGSVGRKFLIAGKGGLNLTHSDDRPVFIERYRERRLDVADWLGDFDAEALREWARGLGVETFVGSSGRVFPIDLKAAPLLRGWVRRLREAGVRFHMHHRWTGWTGDGALRFATPAGDVDVVAEATVLALGGASWPQLGSDGAWVVPLAEHGVDIAPLRAANCGFDVDWSAHFAEKHAGAPLKSVVAQWTEHGRPQSLQGECVISDYGIEGSLVYALSARLREALERDGRARLVLDLVPGMDETALAAALAKPRGRRSVSEHLRRQAGVEGVKAGLLYEIAGKDGVDDMHTVALLLKRLPIELRSTRPVADAISTAGGVKLEACSTALMLRALPGTFCAGEMLDWEAPTGGYLLTACFASGLRAGRGAVAWVEAADGTPAA